MLLVLTICSTITMKQKDTEASLAEFQVSVVI